MSKSAAVPRPGLSSLLAVLFLLCLLAALPLTAAANNALNFDGTNDRVDINNTALGNFGSGDFTVELWMRTTTDGTALIAKRGICDYGNFWALGTYRGALTLELDGGTSATYSASNIGTTINDGQWHHVALVRAGTAITVYIDGTNAYGGTFNSSLSNTAPIQIGAQSICNAFANGDIDEVRIWNAARTQAEIQANQNAEITPPQTGLIAYYNFNHGTAGGSNSFDYLVDQTGNGNNGRLFNLALSGATSNWVAGAPITPNGYQTALPEINVQGNGVDIVDGDTTPSAADGTSFGTVPNGSSVARTFTIQNQSASDALTVNSISLSGANAAAFVVSGITLPVIVAPNNSTTFTVTLNSTSNASHAATVTINNNDLDEPQYDFGVAGDSIPLGGNVSVGAGGTYPSLTGAGGLFADINGRVLNGNLTVTITSDLTEDGTHALNQWTEVGTGNYTVTIQPDSATMRTISGNVSAAGMIRLDGADRVTIDGRFAGSGKWLTFSNTNIAQPTLTFINDASNNTIKFVTLRGVNTSATSGTVVFSTTTGANGNDNNTLDTCDIRDGATTPTVGIYSSGSTGTTAQNNSGNTVSNCNVFNFYNAGGGSSGVLLSSGNTDWTISGNSFYQTATRTAVVGTITPIVILSSTGNFTVTGNFIGGDSPGAAVTTQKWTTTGTTAASVFAGIVLSVGTTTASSVQGNTIANIVWTSSSNASLANGVWSGIYVSAGSVNVGTVTGNTIGSGTGTGSISVTTSGSGGTSFGIVAAGGGTRVIANNTIGSITTNGTTSGVSASLTGISVTAGANTISNNTVGSTTTANSLNATTSSVSGTNQQVTGIISSSASITGNTVANLNNNYASTGSAGQIRGIVTTVGVNTITGNTVRNLSTTSANANTAMTAASGQSVVGIAAISVTAGQTVSQNTVHSLANTQATANVHVTGIYFSGSTGGTNIIARNFVHSLAVSSSSTGSQLKGMEFATGAFTAQNNLVRVGLKADGTSTAGPSTVRGIYDNGTTGGRNFYHNSVWLGGTQTQGSGSTAFASSGVSNARTFQNNIFVITRITSGLSKQYAVNYGGTTVNPTGLTAGGNLLLASGANSFIGIFNGVDRPTLAAWQAATGQDATSGVGDPLFVAPTGDASTVDLHLQASNPAERGGIALTDAVTKAPVTATDDFDGQTRSTLTPVDVGADAGSYTVTPGDLFAPAISYRLLTNGSTANRVLTGWVTIVDNASGGVSDGANAPRLYYKKSTDADVFGGNTAADNGWKYVTGTDAGGGSYSFTLDYALINGGSVSAGDTVQYFVVAQDAANNLGSSPLAASASANPPVQNISAKPAVGVNSFSILGNTISGTVTVGSGGTYPTLTGPGGLFLAIGGSVLTGDLVVNITSDTTEGGVALSEFNSNDYPSTGTLTIQPDSATMRTLSGTAATIGLITLDGADRVTIDGRFGGSGRYLTFRNTSTANTASTILFQNDASNNTVRNCVVEGATTAPFLGVIGFSTGTVTGNDNNLITGCQVRNRSDAAGVPLSLIASAGSSAAVTNSGNTVSNNELFNFNNNGIFISGPAGNDSWTLSGNNIYEVNAATSANTGILMAGGGSNVITDNFIHDLLTTGSQSSGISFSGTSTTTIARNRITAFNVNAATTSVYGINAGGSAGSTLNVVNNQITLSPAASISTALFGLYDNGGSGSVVNVFHNSIVLGGVESSTRGSWASLRNVASTHTARNNIFLNLRTGGSFSHFAAGSEATGGSLALSNNVYAGTGATAANFMDFSGTAATPVPVSFATWQSSTGDTNSQAGIAGSGNFTSAMFVDPAMGDLHINNTASASTLVSNKGTPVASVIDDHDGDVRSPATPDIGSDEFVPNNTAPAITAATGLSRQQDTAASNSQIATVNDAETSPGSLTVTAQTVPAGLSVSNIVNSNGAITADIAASCATTTGDNTIVLEVSDGLLTTSANLIVSVTGNTAPALSYNNPAAITAGDSTTVNPGSASDNGSIASFAVQSQGTYTGTISVNSVGAVSISNAAPAGTHTITIRATDNCGGTTDASFSLTINPPAQSSNAKLSGLTLSDGTLSPTFAPTTFEYSASVANSTTSITVTPTVQDAAATVTVNGTAVASGSASDSIPLNVGSNVISIRVTAEDGTTTLDYTVTVTRAANSNADLAGLTLSAGTLSPDFAPDTLSYGARVYFARTSITVTPTVAYTGQASANRQLVPHVAAVGGATVTVNGTPVASGSASDPIALSVGNNEVTVVVTAEDGTTTKTYTVTVRRLTNLEGWRLDHFGTTEDIGHAANANDYEGDGIPNVIEFATGADPKAFTAMPGELTLNVSTMEFTYPRAKGAIADGFTFQVQWTDDLAGDNWSSTGVTDEKTAEDAETEQRKATVALPPSGQGFMHLEVTAPPTL